MHDSAVVAMSFTIGEFSRLGRVPVKTLRYYDDIALFTAADVDDLTGYRRYRADQLALLNRILALKALGFSLDHIRRMIEEPVDEAELLGMLVLRRAQIEDDLAEATSRINEIESRIHHLDKEHTMTAAILTKIVPAITFAGAREVVADHELMRERCIALDTQACQTISRLDLRVDGPSCALYHPHDTGVDVEMGYPVRTIGSEQIDTSAAGPNLHTLPAAEIAYAVYTGSYDDFAAVGQLHVALREWIADHGATPAGPVRELYLQPSTDPHQGVMELQYPLG